MNELDISKYSHSIKEIVKFHEVDLLSVCNNAVYFNYFEDARLEYLKNLKLLYKLDDILNDNKFFIMAHNEADYFTPAFFDDELTVHTKVEYVKNSSFGFRHIVERKSTGEIIAKGGGVLVYIYKESKAPIPLPKEFIAAVQDFEKDCKFEK